MHLLGLSAVTKGGKWRRYYDVDEADAMMSMREDEIERDVNASACHPRTLKRCPYY